MMSEDQPDVNRRTVLKGTAGVAAAGLFGYSAANPVAASKDKCGGAIDPSSSGTSTSSCSVDWPDWPLSVDGVNGFAQKKAEAVWEMPVSDRLKNKTYTWEDYSSHADDPCSEVYFDDGDTITVGVWYMDLDANGAAAVPPHTVPDSTNGTQWLPSGYDSVDTFVLLDDSIPWAGLADTVFHEMGHALGFFHCDCGLMSYNTEGSMDVEDDVGIYSYISEPEIQIAECAPYMEYEDPAPISHVQALDNERKKGNIPKWEVEWYFNQIHLNDRPGIILKSGWVDDLNVDYWWDIDDYTAGTWANHTFDYGDKGLAHYPSNCWVGLLPTDFYETGPKYEGRTLGDDTQTCDGSLPEDCS